MKGYWKDREAEFKDEWLKKKKSLQEQNVAHVLASYVDIHGKSKAKAVPLEKFEVMMKGSELFTLAALEGLGQDVPDDECSVRPDLEAITPIPWMEGVAWAPGSLYFHGEPWPMCSRNVLKRQIKNASKNGYTFKMGVEPEFFLIRMENEQIVPANSRDNIGKAAYDLPAFLDVFSYIQEIIGYINKLDWKPVVYGHEDANCQFEIDWEPADCLTTADQFTMFKMMAQYVAEKHDCMATFIAKPFSNRTGNGAHLNVSLVDNNSGKNVFDDIDHEYNLSQLGHWFIGGVLNHAEALSAVLAPNVNSYKRLIKTGSITGYTWCPVYCTFGRNNRSNMVRVSTMEGPWQDNGQRVEIRTADGCVNPYLGAAVVLAAGLEGIEKKLDPGPNYEINLYELSDEELKEKNIRVLPRTLLEAVEAFQGDPLMKEVFGDELHKSFCEIKYTEWWNYHRHVSDWEVEQYINTYQF